MCTLVMLVVMQAPLGAEDRVKASNDAFFAAGKDLKARVTMKLIAKDGRERVRDLTMLRLNAGERGEQKYFLYFHKPADVRRTALMIWKYPAREDDRWIFVPAVDLVRRIAADDKRSSFVGSDFTYEDVSGRDVEDDVHRVVRPEKVGDRDCEVVESVPKSPTDHAKRLTWIDDANRLPLKIEYRDERGEALRLFTADEVKEVKAGDRSYWTATRRTMKDVRSGHRTEVSLTSVEYDVGLEDGLFTERNLRNPPAKWIR